MFSNFMKDMTLPERCDNKENCIENYCPISLPSFTILSEFLGHRNNQVTKKRKVDETKEANEFIGVKKCRLNSSLNFWETLHVMNSE